MIVVPMAATFNKARGKDLKIDSRIGLDSFSNMKYNLTELACEQCYNQRMMNIKYNHIGGEKLAASR